MDQNGKTDPHQSSPTIRLSNDVVADFHGRQAGSRLVPCITLLSGSQAGEVIELTHGVTRVGRGHAPEIRVSDAGVSRTHVRLYREGTSVWLEDAGSANGTFVNGERISEKRRLEEDDKVTLGASTVLQFGLQDETAQSVYSELYKSALRDDLTGAYTRNYLFDILTEELTRAEQGEKDVGVVMFDIDHFKEINDTHGHPLGDEILVHIVKAVMGLLPEDDLVARYGGEEFCVLCGNTTFEQVLEKGETIRQEIEATEFEYQDTVIHVTVSVGVATSGSVGSVDGQSIVSEADKALYQAKEDGRNNVKSASKQS